MEKLSVYIIKNIIVWRGIFLFIKIMLGMFINL